MSRHCVKRLGFVVLLLLAAVQFGNAGYIFVKAHLAQTLLARAWSQSDQGAHPIRPWSSADTFPVARLRFPAHDTEFIVLGGASGRNLAFGPTHVSHSPWPGEGGATLIAGHRDTHFRVLAQLVEGDPVLIQRLGREVRYEVMKLEVLHASVAEQLNQASDEQLVLITCYPFQSLNPGTPWRYVVTARPAQPI